MNQDTISKFEKAGHTIYLGNALDVLASAVPDSSIDLIFADPPYNIGKQFANFHDRWPSNAEYAKWCQQWLDACIKKLKNNGSLYVMASTQCMPYLDLYLSSRICIISRIIWHYDSSGVQAKSRYGSMYEPILFCVKDKNAYTFNADAIKVEANTGATRKLIDYRKSVPSQYSTTKVPGNLWYFPRVRYRMPEYETHPTQKPEALLKRIVLASSNPDGVVLDPFSGTFTTSAVAKRLGRHSVGIERELEYVKIGLRRLALCKTLNGEPLQPLKKTYIRKNGKVATRDSSQLTIF